MIVKERPRPLWFHSKEGGFQSEINERERTAKDNIFEWIFTGIKEIVGRIV